MLLAALVALQLAAAPVATCLQPGRTGETRAEWMVSAGAARSVALFQSAPEAPRLEGFVAGEPQRLPRGSDNWLVTLTFHVEHR